MENNYLSMKTVQEMFNLSDKKVRALFKTEGFPGIQLGNAWFVRIDRLDEWFREQEGTKIRVAYEKA